MRGGGKADEHGSHGATDLPRGARSGGEVTELRTGGEDSRAPASPTRGTPAVVTTRAIPRLRGRSTV